MLIYEPQNDSNRFLAGAHGMKIRKFLDFSAFGALAVLLGALSNISVAAAEQRTQSTWKTQCQALARVDFSRIVDAPTQVITANPIEPTGNIPAHCEVQGYVTPQVGFLLVLPVSDWNSKFWEWGCGGDCGNDVSGYVAACATPLQKGYACIGSNAGHYGGGGLWADNNLQAQVDFGYRAIHMTVLAGKAITEHYYGNAPRHSYFCGCSTGGRQALVEAQRFPWDFDGIISGAPWINDSDSAMNLVWAYRALTDNGGKPIVSRDNLKLVHEAVLAQCDKDDGIKDGIIGNPMACKFDPGTLVCRAGQKSGCLTEVQAEAVRKVYQGPVNSRGVKLYVSGAAPGSEMGWVDEGVLDYVRAGQHGGSVEWALEYYRYMVMPAAGPNWELTDFDFDRDYQRFGTGTQESLLNAANPDLRKFKAAGGKLIIYQGWNDQSDLPQMTIDYYETMEKTMGGRTSTEDFARLFVVPGMLHCGGGDGASVIDYAPYLERWVEHNQPPDKIIGAHVADSYLLQQGEKQTAFSRSPLNSYPEASNFIGALMLTLPLDPTIPVTFTRPIYPYPLRAKYKGKGDPTDAGSFGPVGP